MTSALFLQYFPWVLSAITLIQMWMSGKKYKNSWLVTIINQVFWFVWIRESANWGLLPMNLGILILAIRNHYLWIKQDKVQVDVKTPWILIDKHAPYGETCLVKNKDAGIPYITKLRRGDTFSTHYKPID